MANCSSHGAPESSNSSVNAAAAENGEGESSITDGTPSEIDASSWMSRRKQCTVSVCDDDDGGDDDADCDVLPLESERGVGVSKSRSPRNTDAQIVEGACCTR